MILKAARIITGDGKTVLKGKSLRVVGDRITDIGDFGELWEKYPNVAVRDYGESTIMPGLIDMHAHIGYWWSSSDAADYNDFRVALFAADYARKAYSKGVTTIRDVGSPKDICVTLMKAKAAGHIDVPRIITTDKALCFTGGHAWDQCSTEVNGPWAIRAAIRDAIKRGAGWIKLMASHRSNTPEFTQEELNTAVDECHRVGKKIAVHAGTQPSLQMCIDAGFDTIEHGTYLTEDQAKQMAEKGLVWVPTMVAYTQTYEYLDANKHGTLDTVGQQFMAHFDYFRGAAFAYRDNFKKLMDTGVKIVTGTDVVYNNAPVTPVASELMYMVRYGMPEIQAIMAATKTGADTLGFNNIGELKVDNLADICVVDGNPLEDISAMENITEVFAGGESKYVRP